MNDNTPTSVQWNDNPNGTVSFATDVVAKMAGLAATEVEGVASMAGNNNGIADIFSRRMMQNSRNFTKGVKVAIENNRVLVDVSIIIEYGSTVPDVAANIQENVKKAIETMSGLDVQSVDVHIQGLSFEKENRAAQELEEQQQRMLEAQREAEAQAEEPAQEETVIEAAPVVDEFAEVPEGADGTEYEVNIEEAEEGVEEV